MTTLTTLTDITTMYPATSTSRSIEAASEAGWRVDCATNPVEGMRIGLTVEEATSIAAEDGGLLTFFSEVDGPLRGIVFAALEAALESGDLDSITAAIWAAWPLRPYAQERSPDVSVGLIQSACRFVREEERRLDDDSCRGLPPVEG
jgi:hypothetical protein